MSADASLKAVVEASVCEAAQDVVDGAGFTAFEHAMSILDLGVLSRGGDCYYDRQAIGVHYALWYHCQRANDALTVLQPHVARAGQRSRPLDILDIASGTGATLTALRLACARLRAAGEPIPPRVRVAAVESSPPMISMLEAIESRLSCRLPLEAEVSAEVQQQSWFDPRWDGPSDYVETLIVAGYAFDQSDADLNKTLVHRLRRLGDVTAAEALLLIGPTVKRVILEAVAGSLTDDEVPATSPWRLEPRPPPTPPLASGKIHEAGRLRREWCFGTEHAERLLRGTPSWENLGRYTLELRRTPGTLLAPAPRFHGFALDEVQEMAATPEHAGAPRPVAIVGAAGSGKSYVLAERVSRTYDPDTRRILVTAFNKPMVDLLAEILQRRMGSEIDLVGRDGFWFDRSDEGNPYSSPLVLCNRDKLPPRIFDMSFEGSASAASPEGERFIFGKGPTYDTSPATASTRDLSGPLFQLDAYLELERRGAGTAMHEQQRRIEWERFWATDTFARRRARTLAAALEAPPRSLQRFTDVFIDECQDFTEADYRLLRTLVEDPGSIVVAGDEAQSLHLGGSFRRPVLHRTDGTQSRWLVHELEGSYRMPVAICRAVGPLAEDIQARVSSVLGEAEDFTVPDCRKSATWGPRPIVVGFDPYEPATIEVLIAALERMSGHLSHRDVTVADAPSRLRSRVVESLTQAGFNVQRDNMRRIKGLERDVVVVIAAEPPGHDDDTFRQCLFTAVTRATRLLLVAVPPTVSESVAEVLAVIPTTSVLAWDEYALTIVDQHFCAQ